MYLIPVLFLLLLAVFFIFVRHQSGPVQKSRRSRNEGWHDSGSEFSILPIAPSQDNSDISSDSAHQPSYFDASHTTDSFVSTGSVDYGSSSAASGAPGSALAESVDRSGGGGDTYDSRSDFDSSSDAIGGLGSALADSADWSSSSGDTHDSGTDFGSSSDFSSSSDFGSSDSGSSFSDGSS